MDFLQIDNSKIKTLVAVTEEEQARGLKHQTWPPPVMAFPFKKKAIRKFWMKDTPSPLDVIFCRAGRVVKIEEGVPLSEKLIGPDEPCDLVVELPRGEAKRLNISYGSSIKIIYSLITLGKIFERNLAKKG